MLSKSYHRSNPWRPSCHKWTDRLSSLFHRHHHHQCHFSYRHPSKLIWLPSPPLFNWISSLFLLILISRPDSKFQISISDWYELVRNFSCIRVGLNCSTLKQIETSTIFHVIGCHDNIHNFSRFQFQLKKQTKCLPNKILSSVPNITN